MSYEDDDAASQLTDKQKIDIAKWFLLNSPAGEIQYIAKDMKAVLNDERLYKTASEEAFPLYNKSHMIYLEFPNRSGEVMVTPFNEISSNEYIDPRTAQVAIVDHVKQVCNNSRPANDEELPSPYIEDYRYCLDLEVTKYVSEAYPKGFCSVYCVHGKDVEEMGEDFGLAVVISATRLSPQNFWLVLDADNIPLVVPFVHSGMQEIMPVGAKFPRVGKTVTVVVGDPITFDDLVSEGADNNLSRGKLYDAVASRIADRLQKLKVQVETLAVDQALELEKYPSRVTERAARLLQNIDWESLGMGTYMGLEPDDNLLKKDLLPEPSAAQHHPQENSPEERCFGGAGYSAGGGFVSRIRGYMDSTELTVFGARGLYATNRGNNDYLGRLRDANNRPLKVWYDFWKSMYGNVRFPPNLAFAGGV